VYDDSASPVRVVGDSININPAAMEPGEFYCATLHGVPYLYRMNAAGEIEVYGLATD